MDKLKVYLKVLKKHHFWVLAAIVVIVTCSVWSSATGKLETEFKRDKQRIETSRGNLDAVVPDAPNETFKAGVEGLRGNLRKKVYSSWQEMHKGQQPYFVWPKLVEGIGRVRDEFISNWDAKYPAAGAAPPGVPPADPATGATLPDVPAAPPKDPKIVVEKLNVDTFTLRQSYNNNVIRPELQKLFALVRVRTEKPRVAADGKKAPARPRDAADAAEFEGIVFWDETQRNGLINRYFSAGVAPNLGRVLTTQEDLWIFESMLRVIEKLNEKATDPLAAVIKRIEVLDVAQWAMKDAQADAGKIDRFTPAKADTGGIGVMPGAGAAGPGLEFVDTAKPETEDDHWFHNRYLDENMQPLAFSTPAPFAEFKQVFVRMKVLMDQRRAPDLLAACANANLPIEIRQVRMSLDDKTGVGQRPGAAAGQAGPAGGAQDRIDPGPYDGYVDIRGIVYIYNKPDESKVGTGAAGSPAKRLFGIPTRPPAIPAGAGPGGQRPM
jgi:hypothetical protein